MGVRFCKNNFFEGKWLKREIFVQFILDFMQFIWQQSCLCAKPSREIQILWIPLSVSGCLFKLGCMLFRIFFSRLQGVRLFDGCTIFLFPYSAGCTLIWWCTVIRSPIVFNSIKQDLVDIHIIIASLRRAFIALVVMLLVFLQTIVRFRYDDTSPNEVEHS